MCTPDSQHGLSSLPHCDARVPETRLNGHGMQGLCVLQCPALHMEDKWFKLQDSIAGRTLQSCHHIIFHTRSVCDQEPAAVLFLNPRIVCAPVQEEDAAGAGAGGEELLPRVQPLHHRRRVRVHAALPAQVRPAQALRLPSPELREAGHAPDGNGPVDAMGAAILSTTVAGEDQTSPLGRPAGSGGSTAPPARPLPSAEEASVLPARWSLRKVGKGRPICCFALERPWLRRFPLPTLEEVSRSPWRPDRS